MGVEHTGVAETLDQLIERARAPHTPADVRQAAFAILVGWRSPMTGPLAIEVRGLSRQYTVRERPAGLRAALRSVVQPAIRTVAAVSDVSFAVQGREILGFLGPNGAGKTMALKVLSGLLYPTSGDVQVLDFTPTRREPAFLRQITLVAGNRHQLVWDLPVGDSFEVRRAMYGIRPDAYRRMLDELIDMFELAALLPRPVRQLSLGERMKCELAGALLHQPRVLFLDKPTIGLDVPTQRRLRTTIAEYNRQFGATVLLTSHSMADVEALCKRVIVMDHGRIVFDGDLAALVQQCASQSQKTIAIELETGVESHPALEAFADELVSFADGRATLRVPKSRTASVAVRLLSTMPIADLSIVDPGIEEVIDYVFTRGAAEASTAAAHDT